MKTGPSIYICILIYRHIDIDTHRELTSLATLTASLVSSYLSGMVWLAAFKASFRISK